MKRILVLAALCGAALSSPAAYAFDGHGITYSPGQAELTGPIAVWNPWSPPQGTFTGGLVFEYADGSVILSEVQDDGSILETELVGGLAVANLGASYAIHRRVGVGAGMPLFLAQTSDGTQQGPALGDIRFWAPVGIVLPDEDGSGFGLSFVPDLTLGTGDDARYLGADGPRLGGVVAAGYGTEKLRLSGNLGLRATGNTSAAQPWDTDTRVTGVLGASVGYLVSDRVGLNAEIIGQPSVSTSEGSLNEVNPAELLGSARLALPKDVNLVVGGASSLTSSAGAARYRVFAGITWGRRDIAAPDQELVPVVKKAETPYDLTVQARDEDGKGVDANVVVEGEGERYETHTGRDGEAILSLSEGTWEVTLSGDGLGTQSRTVELDEDRFTPPVVEAVLHTSEGEAVLDLALVDPESNGIDDARLQIDGQDYGSTSTGGNVRIEGLAAGEHEVQVDAQDFDDDEAFTVSTGAQETLVLERPPGSVEVTVRTNEGEIVGDAQVRFIGPEMLDPEAIGPTGEQLFVLDEGTWTVVVSSEAYGTQEREVVVDPLRKVLQRVDVVLTPAVGESELRLTVVDPDGNPVPGARVALNGDHLGLTSNGGSFAIGGLEPGQADLELTGERFQPSEPIAVQLVDGVRELVVTLDWKPGTLQVVTRGRGEVPVDALVRFEGPESLDPMPVGPDGEEFFSLAPGDWTVGVSASSFGLQVREVEVLPDETSLIVISAVLREDEGDAVLALAVNDPKGNPIEGARIALDGEPIGATSTGGTLRLEGLAPGDMTLEVAGNLFEYKAISPVSLSEGVNDLDLVLQWLAGTVNVRTVDSNGTPVDALVRAYGPAVLPPVRVGPDGERVLYLEPGGWNVVASSELYGIEEEDVDVEPGQEALVSVAFELEALTPESSAFVLAVQDIDGDPISGAVVRLGDDEHTTPDGGTVVLEDAAAGSMSVAIEAAGYAPLSDAIEVVGGNQTRTLTLDFIPQPVQITVQTDQGEPLEAEVRFVGPATVPSMKSGADGVAKTELRPGAWTVVAQAPELGAGRAEFAFEPGSAPDAMVVELKDTRVQVEGDTVKILQKVQFDTGRATIKEASHPLLDEVANVLLLNPQIVRVEIGGHTDDVGTDETNKKLSQRRAQAVRDYLIDAGVKKSRLVAEGYGSTMPIESNDTEAGRSANRRVQFEILEIDESKKK